MAIGSQEREKILALELRNSCATKHPSALLVPRRAENDKQVHGDEHGEALCVGLWQFPLLWKHLCASSIVMMEPAQDRVGEDLAACMLCWHASSFLLRNLIAECLGAVVCTTFRHRHWPMAGSSYRANTMASFSLEG
jgi:hypothetical protein